MCERHVYIHTYNTCASLKNSFKTIKGYEIIWQKMKKIRKTHNIDSNSRFELKKQDKTQQNYP